MNFFEKINKKKTRKKQEILEELKKEPKREVVDENRNIIEFKHIIQDTKFGQYYDTTRLSVDKKSLKKIDGSNLYNCKVHWLNNEEAITNEEFEKVSNEVLIALDLKLLIDDIVYRDIVMEKLLDKSTVEKYLQMAMEKDPEQPCGNYIGGIHHISNSIIFYKSIGNAIHHSKEMTEKRNKYIQQETEKQKDKDNSLNQLIIK